MGIVSFLEDDDGKEEREGKQTRGVSKDSEFGVTEFDVELVVVLVVALLGGKDDEISEEEDVALLSVLGLGVLVEGDLVFTDKTAVGADELDLETINATLQLECARETL